MSSRPHFPPRLKKAKKKKYNLYTAACILPSGGQNFTPHDILKIYSLHFSKLVWKSWQKAIDKDFIMWYHI